MKAEEKKILMATCYGHFMSHFNMLVFPAVVLPLSARLGLPMAEVLGLSFFMYLFFGLTALPWGMLADRWGGRPFFLIYFSGAGLSGLSAAYWIDNPIGFSISLALLGAFSGIYHPIGLGLISKSISRVSMAMGYNGMFGNLGLAVSPLLTGIVNWLYGPQMAYIVLGSLNLIGVGIVFLLPVPQSAQKQSHAASGLDHYLVPFLILLAAMMLGGIVYRGATVILPAYFELKNQGVFGLISGWLGVQLSANLIATSTASFIFIIGMLGQYSGGRLAEKFNLQRCYLIFHAITVPVVLMMAFTNDFVLVAFAVVYFFFLLGMQPIENTLVSRFSPPRFQHSAYGMKFVLTFGVGALAVKGVEYIERAYRIEWVFPMLSLTSLFLVGFILILIKKTADGS